MVMSLFLCYHENQSRRKNKIMLAVVSKEEKLTCRNRILIFNEIQYILLT